MRLTAKSQNPDTGIFIAERRIVPIGRDGNVVYARTLRRGEEDTGEIIHWKPGDRLVIPEGELVIDLRDIDENYNPKRFGGYRPVANTVWTWYTMAMEQQDYLLFLFALARRTDAAHTLWSLAIKELENARSESSITQRLASFEALATAEMAIIAISRCYQMINTLVEKYCQNLLIPDSVSNTQEAIYEMRNAFEHIDERSEGKIKGRNHSNDALTIFDQQDFVKSSFLRYKNYSLNFHDEVIESLINCRELIMDAIDTRFEQTSGQQT